jgi:hypothetical protein
LIEEEADLRFLNFIGSLQNEQFPPNSLVFHLVDGVYSLDLPGRYRPPKQIPPLPTSSYSALMKLATLDNSIQDAIITRDALAEQINQTLTQTPTDEGPEAEDKARLANRYLVQQQRALHSAQRRKKELQASIAARREAIRSGEALQEKAATDVANATDKLYSSQDLLSTTKETIRGQRRRICEDLTHIFDITPIPLGPPLSFQICGVPLPNTSYEQSLVRGGGGGGSDQISEDAISAALGYVAQLVNALQFYLGVAIPYPITPFGSRSSIRDDISMLPDPQREFPLYLPRGGSRAQFRFDYGWFLLNKDIEALCNAQGLKVVDIRHTLPNLKYLLYVCSAGTDELPERKRGGVRGLWAGRMKSRGTDADGSSRGGSRRASDESDVLAKQREELRRVAIAAGGDHADASLFSPSILSPLGSSFDEGETKLTLRTKGLRENVVK